MADLKVTIGADIEQYKQQMADAGKIATGTSSQITSSLAQAAKASDALGGSAQSTSMKFMQMRSGISAARDGVMAFTLGGQAAERSLMAMGHHINSLVNETGSFKGAMMALGSSLWGPGGIILGVTVLAELYSHYSKASKEAAEDTRAYADTLGGVASAMVKGNEAGQQELTRLKILYDATQNHTLSLKQRNAAYDELEAKYPKWFTNAEREKTLLGENTKAYQGLANAILAAASAKAYEQRIGENAVKVADNQNRIIDLQTKKEQLLRDAIKARQVQASYNQTGQSSLTGGGAVVSAGGSGIEKEITENNAQQIHYKLQIRDLTKENAQLAKLATDSEVKANFKTEQQIDEKNKKIKDGFDVQKALIEQISKALENAIVNKQPTVAARLAVDLETAKAKLTELETEFKNSLTFGHGASPLKAQGTNAVGTDQLGQSKSTTGIDHDLDTVMIIANTEAYKDNVNEILRSYYVKKQYDAQTKAENLTLKELTHTIGTGLTQAFQSALSGTQSFVSAMGQFLLQLIEKLIAAAAAAAVLAILLQATGFGAALGLSSGSTGFSSLFGVLSGLSGLTGGTSGGGTSTLPTHATGGIFTKPHVGVFAEAGPEAIVTPKQLAAFAGTQGGGFQDGQIVGVLKGADLQLQFLRSAKQKKRLT